MIQKFFHTLLLRRHFWRHATLSEVAELYMSRMLRTAAMFMVNSFVSIYLYQLGYSLVSICLVWVGFFAFKALIVLPAARLVAWLGPKHAILVSNLLYIPAMVGFALLSPYGLVYLIPTFMLQATSTAIYMIAYAVDFSKVKSVSHAGKEIAYMNIFEKITTGLSPLIGGFIAFIWGPQVVIMVAAGLFGLAAAPLLRTAEPVLVNQKLRFKGFPWRLLLRHAGAQFSLGFDTFTSGVAWTLYVAIAIIGISASSDEVYAITGILLSVVFFVAIVASYTYGRLIDHRRGGDLMKVATIGNALTHLVRPFVQTPVSVAGLNAVNELSTTGYMLPYTRAVFDNADLSGARIVYLAIVEGIANLGASVAALALVFLALAFEDISALKMLFFIAAGVVLLVLTARFPLYKK